MTPSKMMLSMMSALLLPGFCVSSFGGWGAASALHRVLWLSFVVVGFLPCLSPPSHTSTMVHSKKDWAKKKNKKKMYTSLSQFHVVKIPGEQEQCMIYLTCIMFPTCLYETVAASNSMGGAMLG